jgi:hypothetical protein
MALIQIDPEKAVEYVPVFDRLNKKNPLIVHIKYVPSLVYEEYLRELQTEGKGVTDEKKRLEISKAHDENMFLKQVVKVENFLDSDGNQVTDVKVFYKSIDHQLKMELIHAMVNTAELTAGQRKN